MIKAESVASMADLAEATHFDLGSPPTGCIEGAEVVADKHGRAQMPSKARKRRPHDERTAQLTPDHSNEARA